MKTTRMVEMVKACDDLIKSSALTKKGKQNLIKCREDILKKLVLVSSV